MEHFGSHGEELRSSALPTDQTMLVNSLSTTQPSPILTIQGIKLR